ncbi:MAG: S9 family peptidase [Candidatus Izimaplasma sp.]|nr:S9 family peptidase [Candidatus Izimaplasma bacterium]
MKKIELDTFLKFNHLGNLQASPKETKFAFIVSKANYEDNLYEHTLYLGDNNKINKLRKLKKNNQYVFLDETRILINLQKNKAEEKNLKENHKQSYYLYNLDTKQLDLAFELPFVGSLVKRINDHVILLSANLSKEDHILYEGTKEQRETYIKELKEAKLYEDINELPYYFNGQDFIANKNNQMFLYDVDSKTIKRIFGKEFNYEEYTLSKDNQTIYYSGKEQEELKTFTSKVYAYNIENDEHRVIYDRKDYNIEKIIEIDNQVIIAAKDMVDYGINQNPDFFMIKNHELELLTKYGLSIGNSIGTDCRFLNSDKSFVKANKFYFITTIDDHNEIKSLDLNGTVKTEYETTGSIDGFIKFNDKAIMIAMEKQKLQEVYEYSFSPKKIKQLTRLNSRAISKSYVAKPQTIVVKKADHIVKGKVLLPEDYNPNKKYPAILDIHGGPKGVYGNIYYHEMQYWVNEGYVVFFANPRGSDGKGDRFADIRGKYGTIDYQDLMDFTDKVLNTYLAIDEERVYVTGGSYGGFMTNWIVGQTNRFRAAVTQRSISNWMSFYGTSDIGYIFASDQTDGHPLEDMDKLFNQSPIKYAMNIETPLLFIHADKDYRCPIEQAQQLYAILKVNNIETKMIWVKDENHELSRSGKPQARVKRLKEIMNWFENHK